MNASATSRELILETCRRIVSERGLSALNMRDVAKETGVALGLIYYYFPSKNDLIISTIESVWEDIFYIGNDRVQDLLFTEYVSLVFDRILLGIGKYPNFFTIHSISLSTKGQSKAREAMDKYIGKIKRRMLDSLSRDKQVKNGAFSGGFTEVDLVEFVLLNIISLLVQRQSNCKTLLEVIRRTIY